MALSWNEIKDRALSFSKEWADTSNEEADAKPFLVEFFNVFGISSKRVSTFEHRVKKLDDKDGYIDLLWKGTILIEMKSRGKNLDKAYQQAKDYTHGLKQHELPKYILISDFENFILYDLDSPSLEVELKDEVVKFKLNELVNNVDHFGYILGYQKKIYKEQDPANIKAAELMGKLHDRLEEIGYTGHPLEVYLVRILFILFAEDTTIFNRQQFQNFIEQRTAEDGSDLAAKLQELFQVLKTPNEHRFKNLDEHLAEFRYVNGKLFEENLPTASFDSKMRQALLNCCYIDWSKISPAIFGSMFQSVMNPKQRRNLGAHYTSETNILKLIKPLFLDDLWKEFESIKDNKNKLSEFHKKLSKLKFLDPACGCGNFLVITYRELRLLEIEILRSINKTGQGFLNVREIILLDVDMMCGIEYEEFPARIAEVAMWLIDHQMNMLISNKFGQYFARLPLKKAAKIVHGNALQIEWNSILENDSIDIYAEDTTVVLKEPKTEYQTLNITTQSLTIIDERKNSNERIVLKNYFDYIIGNPPFIGKKEQNLSQKKDIEIVFKGIKGIGVLDYVACWYIKAAQLIQNTNTKVAFVSTNSITQGEQVGILWNILFNHYKIKIHFAYRTFQWSNEAKAKAAVHCVIIGFANFDINIKTIFDYESIRGEAHEIKAKNINPLLIDARDVIVENRKASICDSPEINYGSMPIDNGFLSLSDEERNEALLSEPFIRNWIRPYTGGDEFINNKKRWCLWLIGIEPYELKKSKFVSDRIEKTLNFRLNSNRDATKKLAEKPMLFGEIRQPNTHYIIIPKVSSEKRKYIPIGILEPNIIASGSALVIPNANLYLFGVLTSLMHSVWMATVGGKMKSDYQYSASIVYNNFPFPANISEKQKNLIEAAAQKVLDTRQKFPNNTLDDLYNIKYTPPELSKIHNELDKAVDLAYRSQAFKTAESRLDFLFELYEKYTADLFTKEKMKKTKKQ